MKTSGNISPKQEKLIAYLLTERTIEEACRKAEVAVTTHWRWMKDQHFLDKYREARKSVFEATVNRLQRLTNSAVETLERNLYCENPSVEIRTASLILDHALRGLEMLDLDNRISDLELIQHEQIQNAKQAAKSR